MFENVRHFFDARASEWDANIPPESIQRAKEMITSVNWRGVERVLDIGCGTGVLFPILFSRLKRGARVVALDFSYKMVQQARAKPITGNIQLLQADALNCPFPEKCFDCVVCYNTFPHLIRYKAAFAEFKRLLHPGGMLLVLHSKSRKEINEFHRAIGDAVQRHEIPSQEVMREMAHDAGLFPERLEEGADRYFFLARRPH